MLSNTEIRRHLQILCYGVILCLFCICLMLTRQLFDFTEARQEKRIAVLEAQIAVKQQPVRIEQMKVEVPVTVRAGLEGWEGKAR